MKLDCSDVGFQGVAEIELLRLGCILPARGYGLRYECFHLNHLTEPF